MYPHTQVQVCKRAGEPKDREVVFSVNGMR